MFIRLYISVNKYELMNNLHTYDNLLTLNYFDNKNSRHITKCIEKINTEIHIFYLIDECNIYTNQICNLIIKNKYNIQIICDNNLTKYLELIFQKIKDNEDMQIKNLQDENKLLKEIIHLQKKMLELEINEKNNLLK